MFYCRWEKKIAQQNGKIEKMERDMHTKEDLKTVALGTSKINYLDPRITVAWCKRHEVPIEKVKLFLETNCQDGSRLNKRNKFFLTISKKVYVSFVLDIHQVSFGEVCVGDGCRTRLQILAPDGIEKLS